jgi:hypothetical protein
MLLMKRILVGHLLIGALAAELRGILEKTGVK